MAKKKRVIASRKSKPKAKGDPADWRSETLAHMRKLILEAEPQMTEERKWKKPSNPAGVPTWSLNGIVCTGETYKNAVKLTFAKGASVPDPGKLFNSSQEGNTRRAIDIHEGEAVNARAFKALVKSAVALNGETAKEKKPKATAGAKKSTPVKLLSGGNPQIAKAEGDAPVQAYIAAMPGWKQDIGRWLDDLIEKNVPNVQKAVKWNSPFYGVVGEGWILATHCLTKYVKVTFFKGKFLRPLPPGGTPKSGESRWLDIYEHDKLDATQMTTWIKQAAAIPGWMA